MKKLQFTFHILSRSSSQLAQQTIKVPDKITAQRLLRLAYPHKGAIAGAVGLLSVSSAVTMAVPYSMGAIIDTVSMQDGPSLTSIFLALGGVFGIGAAANTGRILLFKRVGERIIANLRKDLFKNIIHQDLKFHDLNSSGELVSRLAVDTVIVGKSVTSNVSDGLRSLIMASAGVGAMAAVNSKLTLIMMSIVPPIAVAAIFYGKFVSKISKRTMEATAALTKLSEEKISQIRTVKAFAQEEKEEKVFKEKAESIYNFAIKDALASGIFFGGAGLSGNLTILALLYYGGSMVQSGEITVGALTSFFLYTAYVGSSMIGLSSWYSEVMKGIGASARLFELLDKRPDRALTGTFSFLRVDGRVLENVKGLIEFKNVSFNYPTRDGVLIFKDLTFSVKPGEAVAIVGSSGSGKSTIAQLLLGFYAPNSGQIYIDGNNIQELNASWMREKVISIVPQEPVLFSSTLLENLTYGVSNYSKEELWNALHLANASDFINQFPDKLNTIAGERGLALSGGQKQRIAIARAVLKNPKILILDEATSALDAASESLVQEALDNLVQGRTVITIAHRLSTIQKADRIIMLENGKVVESGTFSELTSGQGKFGRLIQNQLLQK